MTPRNIIIILQNFFILKTNEITNHSLWAQAYEETKKYNQKKIKKNKHNRHQHNTDDGGQANQFSTI